MYILCHCSQTAFSVHLHHKQWKYEADNQQQCNEKHSATSITTGTITGCSWPL